MHFIHLSQYIIRKRGKKENETFDRKSNYNVSNLTKKKIPLISNVLSELNYRIYVYSTSGKIQSFVW